MNENKFLKSICALSTAVLLVACGSGEAPSAPSGITVSNNDFEYVRQNSNGFIAIVSGNFTVAQMQSKWGDYCDRHNKIMRSLRMDPYENGQKQVSGDCL